MPQVRVLRPFANGSHDDITHPGDVLIVSADRAADLMRNGLADAHRPAPPPAPPNKACPAALQPGRKPAARPPPQDPVAPSPSSRPPRRPP